MQDGVSQFAVTGSVEQKIDFGSIIPPSEESQDNPGYTDIKGFSCSSWDGFDCSNYYGYETQDLQDIRENCPTSCGISHQGGYSICSAVRYDNEAHQVRKRILTSESTNSWWFGHFNGDAGVQRTRWYNTDWNHYRDNISSKEDIDELDWLLMCASLDEGEGEAQEMVYIIDEDKIHYVDPTSVNVFAGAGGRPDKVVINSDRDTSAWAQNERSDFQILELITFDRVLSETEMRIVINSFKSLLDKTSDLYDITPTSMGAEDLFVALNYCPSHCPTTNINFRTQMECYTCAGSYIADGGVLFRERSTLQELSVEHAVTLAPTKTPTKAPTKAPTMAPTKAPTRAPTQSPTTRAPTAAQCNDRVKNGGETDVDCGGDCLPCAPRKLCSVDGDCQSRSCTDCLWEGCDPHGGKVCASPTDVPTLSPTVTPTKVPTSEGPTKAPTKVPTQAPTKASTKMPTKVPTIAPTVAPSLSPTELLNSTSITMYEICGVKQKCLRGFESCCDSISSNMFITSKITERILFYDLKTREYIKFLERNAEEETTYGVASNEMFVSDSDKLTMSMQHGSSQIAFSTSGREIFFTRSATSTASGEGSLEAFHAQVRQRVAK